MMLALIPLLLNLAPGLIAAFAGDKAGDVATNAVAIAKTITGTSNEADAAAAIASDPGKASEVALAMQRIAVDARAAQEQQETDRLTAALADADKARQATAELVKQGSWLAWGAPMVTVAVLGLFGWVVVAGVSLEVDIRETLKNLAVACVGYWIGSSRGSAAKEEARRS